MITKNRLRIDQNYATMAAMEDIMRINSGITFEELGSKGSYKASAKLLQGVKTDV